MEFSPFYKKTTIITIFITSNLYILDLKQFLLVNISYICYNYLYKHVVRSGNMAILEWNENFSVTVKELDDQHKKLVNILNVLHNAMKKGEGKLKINLTLDELVSYTKFHFAHEEKLMKQYNYPTYTAHKKEHEDLIQKVVDYLSQFNSGKTVLPAQLIQFLKEWIVNHIGQSDKKYGPFLSEKMKK